MCSHISLWFFSFISLMINDVENLFTCLLSSCISSLVSCPSKSLASFFSLDCHLLTELSRVFIYSGLKFFVRYLNDEYFLFLCGSPSHFIGVFPKVEVTDFDQVTFINLLLGWCRSNSGLKG